MCEHIRRFDEMKYEKSCANCCSHGACEIQWEIIRDVEWDGKFDENEHFCSRFAPIKRKIGPIRCFKTNCFNFRKGDWKYGGQCAMEEIVISSGEGRCLTCMEVEK